MCRLCFAPGKAIAAAAGARNPRPELPVPRAASGLAGRHEVYDFPLGGTGLQDDTASVYLADLLTAVNAEPANVASGGRLEAVHVDSDGNCLHHAVSRAIFGREVFYAEIRAQVAAELEAHAAWYLQHVYMGSDVDFQADLSDARTSGEWSSTNQIVAIANVLRRPVALLASLAHMNGTARGGPGGTAIYLPARHPAGACATNPLLLAWQTGAADGRHYVALCRTAGAGVELPPACRPAGVAPAGFAAEAYIPVGCFCLSGLEASSFSERNPINNPFVAEVRAFAVAGRLALAALQSRPEDFVALLDDDEKFLERAEAAGLHAVAAIVQHIAQRDATRVIFEICGELAADEASDAAAGEALKHVLEGLPAHVAAALRMCICSETEASLYQTIGTRLGLLGLQQLALLNVAIADLEAKKRAASSQHFAGMKRAREEDRERRWQAHLEKVTLRGVELRHRARRGPGTDSPDAPLRATESAPAVLMSNAQLTTDLLSALRNAKSATARHELPRPPLRAVPSAEAQESAILRALSGPVDRSVLGKRKAYPESDSEGAGDDANKGS